MVQLSPSPTLDVTDTPVPPAAGAEEEQGRAGSPNVSSPVELLNLEASTPYPGYEAYIEDGLICLKHKVRNLEKKKVRWLYIFVMLHRWDRDLD